MSGSAIASASAIGWTMVPLMKVKGYPLDYSVDVTVTAAIVGLLIPRSHKMGTFMDMAPLIVITTPMFLPVATGGAYPFHPGIIMMLNPGIGLVTPPVGPVLFVGSAVGMIPVTTLVKTIWPLDLTLVAALGLLTYVPALSLCLPAVSGN